MGRNWVQDGGRSPVAIVMLVTAIVVPLGLLIWDISSSVTASRLASNHAAELSPLQLVEKSCGQNPVPACAATVIAESAKNSIERQDLTAQKEMSRYALGMLIVTFVQAIVGGVGLFLLIGTFRQGEENTRLLHQGQYAEHRTWIEVELPQVGIIIDGDSIQVQAELVVTNAGRSPALEIQMFIRPIRFRFYLPTDKSIENIIAEEQAVIPIKNKSMKGGAILPSKQARMSFTMDAVTDPGSEAQNILADILSPDRAKQSTSFLVVYGCFYKSISDKERINWSVQAATVYASNGTGIDFVDGTYTSEMIKAFPLDSYTSIS